MLSKEDLQQIKEVVEAIVTPRFNRIDEKLEEHDVQFEGIFFAFDRLDERVEHLEQDVAVLKEDMQEVKSDIKIIKADMRTVKSGLQTHELRLERLEEKVIAA